MAKVNEDFLKLSGGYLFPEIARRTKKMAGKESWRKGIETWYRQYN